MSEYSRGSHLHFWTSRSSLRIVAGYALFAGVWILLSDWLLEALVSDPVLLSQLQTLKGWTFVAVTAGLLALFMEREFRQLTRAGKALQQLALIGAATDEEGFLRRLTAHLSAATEQEFALVSLLEVDGSSFHALLLEEGTSPRPLYDFPVVGTPCGTVLQQGIHIVPRHARKHFPGVAQLTELAIESYAGSTIRDEHGATLGVLSVMSHSPLRFPRLTATLLQVFANRTGSELARLRTLARQEALTAQMRGQFNQFATVLEAMNIGTAVVDAASDRILHLNRMAADLFGPEVVETATSAELLGASLPLHQIQEGEGALDLELPLPPNQRWHHCLAKSIRWTDGQPARLWLLVDIHDRRELEQLRGRMLTTLSHEMRTPLTSLLGFTELMLEAQPSDSSREYLQLMQQECERLDRLVNNFVTLQRLTVAPETPKLGVLRLEPILRNVINLLSGYSPRHQLELICPEPLPAVAGMVEHLQELLYQLVLNAIRFSPDGGTVTLRATRCHQEGAVGARPRHRYRPRGKGANLQPVLPWCRDGRGRWDGAGTGAMPQDHRIAPGAHLGGQHPRRRQQLPCHPAAAGR